MVKFHDNHQEILDTWRNVLPEGTVIFGSFVRSLLAKKYGHEDSYNDIDIFITPPLGVGVAIIPYMIGVVSATFGEELVSLRAQSEGGYYATKIIFPTFAVDVKDLKHMHRQHQMLCTDASVNSLYLSLERNKWNLGCFQGSSESVLELIQKKEFIPGTAMLKPRREKLLAAGYKEVQNNLTSNISF